MSVWVATTVGLPLSSHAVQSSNCLRASTLAPPDLLDQSISINPSSAYSIVTCLQLSGNEVWPILEERTDISVLVLLIVTTEDNAIDQRDTRSRIQYGRKKIPWLLTVNADVTCLSDVPRLSSALLYRDESGISTSDVTLASPSYGLSSRRGGQPNNFPAVQNIQQSSLRHSVHSSTPPINYPSGVYDGDVTTERAYNTQRNYRASAGDYNSTAMDTLTTDFAHMGTRFSTQGPSDLDSDILESHDYQPASPRKQHQHNHFPASGYSPPILTLSRNSGVHQIASGRMMYSPMPGIGSGHTETHVTSEQSSPPLGTLRNRKAYSIRGESGGVYEPLLDWRYQVQRSPSEFFIVGRVFAILWHEGRGQQGTVISQAPVISDFHSQGRSTQNQFTRGRFGEEIFSGIRRMVVVKAMSQCAWCVPITTYGGKGVAKPGVDPAKHAIVYMRGSVPTCRADEPQMTKEPLEINPVRPDERLDEMSRLNFGKVYTVEHNVKVRHVGMISYTSMVKFRGYASNEFRLDI